MLAASRPTLAALTGLRFLAAMHVVLYHFGEVLVQDAPEWVVRFLHSGSAGVPLFFILSGFILAYNHLDGPPRPASGFWTARFARIYPIYSFAFLLMAPFYVAFNFARHSPGEALGKTLVSAVASLTLTQAWVPPLAHTWNTPAWTLSAEALFYALFPFIAVRMRSWSRRQLVLGVVAAYVLTLIGPVSRLLPAPGWWFDWASVNPIFRLPEFVIGVLLGRLFLLGSRAPCSGVVTDLSAVCLLGLCCVQGQIHPLAFFALLYPLLGLLVVGLASGKGAAAWATSTRLLVLLGHASYSLYILQYPLAAMVKTAVEWRMDVLFVPMKTFFPTPGYCLGYLAVLVSASLAAWWFVETPARKAILSLFPVRREGRVSEPRHVVGAALEEAEGSKGGNSRLAPVSAGVSGSS